MHLGATVGAAWMLAAAWSAILPGRINWKPAYAVWPWNACKEAGSLILPCRMFGCTGNSYWKMPCSDLHGMTRDEPCSCSIYGGRINSVCRNILELLDCVWKHCSSCRMDYMWKHHCILYSKID